MCIYITIAILPLYYQEILGYTAFAAGLVVGPRGIGSFIGSPIIGILGSRVDNRKLLTLGFIGFGVCSLYFGMVNLEIGPTTLLVPILITGFSLSFVFVPLATLSTATVPREQMGNATGLFNMLRNIGGSIGIAMASTALVRRADFYQTEIGARVGLKRSRFTAEIGAGGGLTWPGIWATRRRGPARWGCSMGCCNSRLRCERMWMYSAGRRCWRSFARWRCGSSASRRKTPGRRRACTR